jgi:hypothetical protein
MNGYPAKDRALGTSVVLGASLTNSPISQEVPVTAGGSRNMVVAVLATAVTGTVDLMLQTAVSDAWVDVKAATISAAGYAYIRVNVQTTADQAVLPLLGKVRVVATTGGGEALTVSNVWFFQEQ